MKIILTPLVLVVLALSYSMHGQTKERENSILAKYAPQSVDKADTNSVYTLEWLRYMSMKYHLIMRDSVPAHLRKMNSPFQQLAVLVRDQGITQEDMVTYKLFRRLPVHPSLHMDSLGRAQCVVYFRPTSPAGDTAFIKMLRDCGSQLSRIDGPMAGGSIAVVGFFPICHLEDIAKRKEVILVDKLVHAVFD